MAVALKTSWRALAAAALTVCAGAALAAEPAAKPAAAQPAPAQPAPAQPTPAQNPAQPNPAQANPAQAAQPSAPAAPAAKSVDGWTGEVAKGSSGIALDETQTKAVKTVSNYFASLQNLKGAFVQIGADNKRMRGKFFVKRPGRFRFDYALPSRQIIISDGDNLAIQDLDLNNEDRVALDQTPFRLLLRKDVDLLRDARIVEVQESSDRIVLALQDKNPDTPGKIRLFLATQPAVELKEWVTTDAQGLDTKIEVSELIKTETIDDNLFKIQMLGNLKAVPR